MKYKYSNFRMHLKLVIKVLFIILCSNKANSYTEYYYGEVYNNPFNEEQKDQVEYLNPFNTISIFNKMQSYRDSDNQIVAYGPIVTNSPTTELGKKLTDELLNIKMETTPLDNKADTQIFKPKVSLDSNLYDLKIKKKKKKSKNKTKKKVDIALTSTINKEYFQLVPRELGKAVSFEDACNFVPTPINKPLEDLYWKKIDYSNINSRDKKVEFPVVNQKNPFRSSSECLHLFEESISVFKKEELLISPENFVGLVRQIAMQLRDSLKSPKYVISTEDTCLAMRIILYLPHLFRNVVNCKSAIIASIRDEEEMQNYEILNLIEDHSETKFKDVTFACKSILKFQDFELDKNNKDIIFYPNQLYKLFRLDLTEQDLQFYNRLSLPHRKSALNVQKSYLKYTHTALLYDVAAAIIFLLNELHEIDQSLEQCVEVVTTCIYLQEKDKLLNSNSIYENICKELGVFPSLKRYKTKYNSYTLIQILKRLTHEEPIFENNFIISNSLPSGKKLLPVSEHGFSKRASVAQIWPNIGTVFSDGTVSSSLIPVCTGIPASELNRFLVLNNYIKRYLAVSGLSRTQLTVEDICLICKYYLSYKRLEQNMNENLIKDSIKKEDFLPMAICKVAQQLNLELFTFSSCKEIYKEFFQEEEAALKKISGFTNSEKMEKYYSKPLFTYNSNFPLKHLPKIMTNGNEFSNTHTWKALLSDYSCSNLAHHIINRMILFVGFTLSYWKKKHSHEKLPFNSIFDICKILSSDTESYVFSEKKFIPFVQKWLLEKDDTNMYSTILESIWNNFITYERAAFPKRSEESEESYIKRIYHFSLIAEPLYIDEWSKIELPIRMDIAEFIKLLPFVERPIGVLSTKDKVTINYLTLIKAFLESFFEETYSNPVVIDEKDILILIDRRELEKRSMDELFFEIQHKKEDWKWLREETAAHAILMLLEYLKTVKISVEEQIKRTATDEDIYSSPRAIFSHGKWLIKSPQPIFFPANDIQKHALPGYPKYLLNKAKYIQAYFIKAFERILQFDLNIQIGDVIMALTNCEGNDEKFVELLTERISNRNNQEFITTQVVKEIYSACITFSFYRYTLKGALSEEQAFAAPRVFYKPSTGWEFLKPNVPDFSKLLVLSKIFKADDQKNFEKDLDSEAKSTNNFTEKKEKNQHLTIKPYTWSCLEGFLNSNKLEIWQLNRAISMCAYFNHWLSYKFSKKENKELQAFNCVNAIYNLSKFDGRYTQSEIVQIFAKYISIPYLKEGDILDMLSAFNSYELMEKPNNMGKRQWLMSLYRIPQIQETGENSTMEKFKLLRFPTPPKFNNQRNLYVEHVTKTFEIPEVFIPKTLDKNSLNYFVELLQAFVIRYLERIGFNDVEIEKLKFSFSKIIDECTKGSQTSLREGFKKYFEETNIDISPNFHKKISEAFYKFVILKFSGSNEETFEQIINRISSKRVITDEGYLPFDIPLGIVPGKFNSNSPYNSLSFGELNFARLIVAYFNEYLIEQEKTRDKIKQDIVFRTNGVNFPEFIKEECIAKALNIMRQGGIDIQQSIEQTCLKFRWLNQKLLRTIITGLLTYCQLNLNDFPKNQASRGLLDFAKENLVYPIVSFEEVLHTWTMKDIKISDGNFNLINNSYSTLESIGEFDQNHGIITFTYFSYCSGMNVSQINRLVTKLQYYKYCISENSLIIKSDLEKILDMNLWCLASRQEIPDMRKTYSNLIFNYFGIPGTVKQTFEVLEDAFEIVEHEWLEKTSLKTFKQNIHDSYSVHTKALQKINSLIKSKELFCPKILLEDDLRYLQQSFKEKIINRITAFSGFSELYFREKYGIIFEPRPVIITIVVSGYKKIESSQYNIDLIKSMIPQVTNESIQSLFEAFNNYEEILLAGGLTSIEEIYQNPICEKVQGNWFFFVPIDSFVRDNKIMNVKLFFTEQEINRIQTIVAFINEALEAKYSEKLKGSTVTFKHIALLLKADIDLTSYTKLIYHFHSILQDDLNFSPWLTVSVLKSIIKPFIIWEKNEILKSISSENNFLIPLSKIKSKYTNVPVSIINGKWQWYTWCKKPDYRSIIHRVNVLGDEVLHTLSLNEKSIYGIPSTKHFFEIAALYIQYFLQEVLYILVPYKPELTMQIIKGKTNLDIQIAEFLKSIWEQYLNSYIYKGAIAKHDLFHNPIVLVINKQRFFPLTGFPQFDYFDLSLLPKNIIQIEKYYGGYNVGSKYAVHRIVSVSSFINLSFESFISKSKNIKETDILTNIGIFQLLNGRFEIPLLEIKEEMLIFFNRNFNFYVDTAEKKNHLIRTIDNYTSFEKSMFGKGWKMRKLYEKPLVFAIQNGYQMNYNLKDYLPNKES